MPPSPPPPSSSESSILEFVPNDHKKIILKTNNTVYSFDHIFNEDSTQEQIYENIGSPVVQEVLKG